MVHDPLRTPKAPAGQSPEAGGGQDGERIAKVLARAGVASRREVERLIEAGRVALNGRVLNTPGVRLGPGDIVTLDGEVVAEAEPARLFRYHKPVGLVTSHSDPQGRPLVFEALPPGLPRLISVGRLDVNTEGLLLLTNDGGLARALELPATALVRRYRARAHGRITQEKLDKLKDGVTVEGVRYGAIEAVLDKAKDGPTGSNLWITLTLAEGKNREVRRVLESLGLKVNRLIRLSYGPFALATLPVGEVEEVGPRVIREQLAEHIDPANLPTSDKTQWRAAPSVAGAMRRAGPGSKRVSLGDPSLPEPPKKKEFKPGWAKPKPKTGHATKSRPAKPGPPVIGKNRVATPKMPVKSSTTKPRPSGSPPAPGRLSERSGRSPSASRPRNLPARRPAPRPGGGSKPRG